MVGIDDLGLQIIASWWDDGLFGGESSSLGASRDGISSRNDDRQQAEEDRKLHDDENLSVTEDEYRTRNVFRAQECSRAVFRME